MIDFKDFENTIRVGDIYQKCGHSNPFGSILYEGYYKVVHFDFEGVVLYSYGYYRCAWEDFGRLIRVSEDKIEEMKARQV